jgi:hypothetical protein
MFPHATISSHRFPRLYRGASSIECQPTEPPTENDSTYLHDTRSRQ